MKTFFQQLTICMATLIFSSNAYSSDSSSYCGSLTGDDDLSKFHRAVCNADVESVRESLGKGIDVNKMQTANVVFWNRNNRFEFNALHTSLREFPKNKKNYTQIVRLLIKSGINPETPYRYWSSDSVNTEPKHLSEYRPLTMAPNREIAELLAQGGAKTSPLALVKSEGGVNYFRGKIVVSGEIHIDPNDEFQGGMLCMSVDKATSHLIPRVGDPRSAWFCFENMEDATRMLKIDSARIANECLTGNVTVEIADYRQDTNESEVSDFAKLVRIIKATSYKYGKCPS